MKKLNQFTHFDTNAFFKDKTLMAMKSEDLVDFDSKAVTGAKYTLLIWMDGTSYGEDDVSNAGEAFTVKVLGAKPRSIAQPTEVNLTDPIANIYGEYRNQLSITAKDVVPVAANK